MGWCGSVQLQELLVTFAAILIVAVLKVKGEKSYMENERTGQTPQSEIVKTTKPRSSSKWKSFIDKSKCLLAETLMHFGAVAAASPFGSR